jgi:hypothetical protein
MCTGLCCRDSAVDKGVFAMVMEDGLRIGLRQSIYISRQLLRRGTAGPRNFLAGAILSKDDCGLRQEDSKLVIINCSYCSR